MCAGLSGQERQFVFEMEDGQLVVAGNFYIESICVIEIFNGVVRGEFGDLAPLG